MSNPSASHVRPSYAGRTWRRFGRWRRSRPFWGGLMLVLSGIEVFLSTQLSLGGLSFQLGPTGFLSWLIPTILAACGVLAWVTPQQRLFYAVVGAVTAVFSLIGVNLGGFFLGLVLGIVGAGLVFGWTPIAAPPVAATPDGETAVIPEQREPVESDVDEPALDSENLVPGLSDRDGRFDDRSAAAFGSSAGGTEASAEEAGGSVKEGESRADTSETVSGVSPDDPGALPRRESPRFYTVIGLLLVLGMTAVVGLRAASPAYAAPCPKPTVTAPKPPPVKPDQPEQPPAATPTPTPTETSDSGGGIIGGIVDGIAGLFKGDSGDEAADPSPEPRPTTTAPKPAPTRTSSAPTKPKPAGCAPKPPASSGGQAEQPTIPLLADQGLPYVNSKPSQLTGSKLTMWDLRIAGITTLHTKTAGDMKVLKFTMSRSVVDDFRLRVPQGEGRPLVITSDPLVVHGDVAFYATRFVGRILGVKLTLTPDSPLPPEGIPLTVPKIEFSDPEIQLAYVSCNTLEAPTLNESFPPASV